MKKLFKGLTLGLVSVAAIIAISGCGGGGGGSTTDDTITHNGFTYKTVTSPTTGKVWLDRNLGAAEVCTSYNDTACYGDYYQWGRNADGHEDSLSSTTTTQATSVDNVGHSQFITANSSKNYDWAHNIDPSGSQRIVNWSKTDGSSVCPIGFRVPTYSELQAELSNIHNRNEAYNSFLKLPSAGGRRYDGNIVYAGTNGYYFSVTATSSNRVKGVWFTSTSLYNFSNYGMANGLAVRCIKN